MTTPDFRKYGYEPELDSVNHFSYINKNHRHGLPYRIGAAPDGSGGWNVYIDWKAVDRHDPSQQMTTYEQVPGDLHNYAEAQSQREKRFDAAMVIERAMKEYSEENYGPGSSGDDFDFGGGGL